MRDKLLNFRWDRLLKYVFTFASFTEALHCSFTAVTRSLITFSFAVPTHIECLSIDPMSLPRPEELTMSFETGRVAIEPKR